MTPHRTPERDALAIARREKTLALMMNPPRPTTPKARGHREWMIPLAERKAR